MVLCVAAEARQEGSALASAGAIQATKADDQVAQGRQVARCMAGADGGKILTKRDVADAVETLDLPVTTPRGLNLCRGQSRLLDLQQARFKSAG